MKEKKEKMERVAIEKRMRRKLVLSMVVFFAITLSLCSFFSRDAIYAQNTSLADELALHSAFSHFGNDDMLFPSITMECFEKDCDKELSCETLSFNSVCVSENSAIKECEIGAETAGYSIPQDAVMYIRKQFVKRNPEFTLTLTGQTKLDKDKVTQLVMEAFEDSQEGAPNEGDYLYWHIRNIGYSLKEKGNGTYDLKIAANYLSNETQENFVKAEIDKIIVKLGLRDKNKTDYEKVKIIYDYLIANVAYDYSHFDTNRDYLPMYAAYSALEDGYTVCQGYATVFYRICKTLDIPVRLIAGRGMNENHGWNIVKIGEYYYNIDITWDDEGSCSSYTYFMKNMDEFYNHIRFDKYATSEFMKSYKMTPVSYSLADSVTKLCAGANMNVSLNTLGGSKVNVTAQNGKTRLLIFVDPSKQTYTKMVTKLITKKHYEQADVIFLDTYSLYQSQNTTSEAMMKKLRAFLSSNRVPSVPIVLSNASTVDKKKKYANLAGVDASEECAYVVIDADNIVRYYGEGSDALRDIDDVLQLVKATKKSFSQTNTIKILSAKQTANDKIAIGWNAVEGATSYLVYRKINGGKYVCLGSVNGTSCTIRFSSYGTYTFHVVAMKDKTALAKSGENVVCATKKLPPKGKTVSYKGMKYKITSSTDNVRTVAFCGSMKKKQKNVVIPAAITIDSLSYKVTEIASKACKKNTSLRTVLVGENVTKIGSYAFEGCKNIVALKIKGKKIKKVGRNAMKGIVKKATVIVPSSKKKYYKKLFTAGGLAKSVKVVK